MRKLILGLASLVALVVSCPSVLADYDYKEGYTRISRGMAHRIALTQVGGYITNSDLDVRQGRLRWKVQVRDPYYGKKQDVFVDAMTGVVTGVKFRRPGG